MKMKLSKVITIIFCTLIVVWLGIVLSDYFRATKDLDAKFCIKEETKSYEDGTTYICTGLGYKMIRYDRDFKAVEFGPFFIKEKQSLEE